MSGGISNSPGWVKPTTGHTSSFEEGQESILELLREPDEAILQPIIEYGEGHITRIDVCRALAAKLQEQANG